MAQRNIEGIFLALEKQIANQFGFEVPPIIIADTTAVDLGTTGAAFFYCIKPLGADAVIDTVKGIDGTTISGLSGITIAQNDEFKFPLSYIKLTSGTVVAYKAINLISFNKN